MPVARFEARAAKQVASPRLVPTVLLHPAPNAAVSIAATGT